MDDARELWRVAARRAELSDQEQERLAIAIEVDDDLGAELTYLLGHLAADLSGPFLREFVDELPADEELAAAGLSVLPALRNLLARPAVQGGGVEGA